MIKREIEMGEGKSLEGNKRCRERRKVDENKKTIRGRKISRKVKYEYNEKFRERRGKR